MGKQCHRQGSKTSLTPITRSTTYSNSQHIDPLPPQRKHMIIIRGGLPWRLRGLSICLQCGRPVFNPWVGKIPWRRKWQPTPVLLPWRIPWMKEPGRLQSTGSQRVRHDWATSLTHKREHKEIGNHKEIRYKIKAAMSFPNLRPHRFLSTKPLYQLLRPLITYPNLSSLLQQITHSCIICSSVSPQGALKPVPSFPTSGSRTYPRRRLANWLHSCASNRKNKTHAHSSKHFSGWIEAFPRRPETASEVTQFLIWEIIPCFGLPLSPQSNNEPGIISQITQQVAQSLGITQKLHIPYRPQSSRKVEKANSILKTHLIKLSLKLQRPWTELLPMALAYIKATPQSPSFLSPFELMYEHPFQSFSYCEPLAERLSSYP